MIDATPPAANDPPPLFGVLLGGVPVVLPEGVPVVYLTDAAIYPLPGAPPRVMGLMQVQGHPVVVLDPGSPPQRLGATTALRRRAVLVLGAAPASAALRVEAAPMPIAVTACAGSGCLPDCAFASALLAPLADVRDASRIWWRFSSEALFGALASDGELSG